MRYPIVIEPGTNATAWGVVVPDLPGCFSAGDTQEEAMIQAEDVTCPQSPYQSIFQKPEVCKLT